MSSPISMVNDHGGYVKIQQTQLVVKFSQQPSANFFPINLKKLKKAFLQREEKIQACNDVVISTSLSAEEEMMMTIELIGTVLSATIPLGLFLIELRKIR